MNWRKLRTVVLLVLILCIIPATRFNEIDTPLFHLLKGPAPLDPLSLHLSGEFVESNLGTAKEPDGSITVRMIAQQYLFVPHCVLIPAGVPVRFRITSADVVHSLSFLGTDYLLKTVPGVISQARLQFSRPGIYKMPCHEFCGAGHYAMRSELRVVPRDQFPALQPDERRVCEAR